MDNNKMTSMFWPRVLSAFIDVVFIACVGYWVRLLIMQLVFIDPIISFATIGLLYYWACYLFLNGRTLAKVLTGLQVIANNNNGIGIKQILMREFIGKLLVLLVVPEYLLSVGRSQILIAALVVIALVTVTPGILLFFKRTWWELLSGTTTIKNPIPHRPMRFAAVTTIVAISLITIVVNVCPFSDNRQLKTAFYPKYPVNAETKRYADFIHTHSQNPVDYVFSLFEKYDLVVLSERMHPEYTQYELISKLISDKRFAGKIGNIYTECGSISFQDTLDNYMNTRFASEDSLNRATAFLQRNSNAIWPLWSNTNLFDLLKHVNVLNNNLADSLKINWYFTDIPVDWQTMTPLNYRKQAGNDNRDATMANHIVEVYKNKLVKGERRNKGLVIMNFRHGYGLIKDGKGRKTDHYFNKTNTTAILMDSLHNKVCNVMLNTVSFRFGFLFTPIQNGKWDRAFSISGNPDVGFDFENSPFGDEQFDGFVGNPSDGLKYQDLFTGFIFYKPLEQHINKVGFPYMLYNFEDSIIRRAKCVSLSHAEGWKNRIAYYKNNHTDEIDTETLPYAAIYNLVVNVGFSIIVLLALILSLIVYWVAGKCHKVLNLDNHG